MNKFFIVLRREYLTRVQKKSFIIFTLLTPLLFIGLVALTAVLGITSTDTSEKQVVVLDSTGKYASLLKDSDTFKFAPATRTIEDYRSNPDEETFAYVQFSDDLLSNPRGLTIYSPKQIPSDLEKYIESLLLPTLRNERMAQFDIPNLKEIIAESNVVLNISTVKWSKDGSENVASSIVASTIGQVFNFLIYMFIMMYGMMVMQSVREEKKNRIVEIIISSVPSHTLLFGKICAVGLVGFTQMFIWIVALVAAFVITQLAFLGAITFNLAELSAQVSAAGSDPSIVNMVQGVISSFAGVNFGGILLAFIFYFIFGYFTYASIFAAVGAAVDNDEDVNQMLTPITMIILFAFYAGFYSASNPDGPMALWSSFFPLTSPFVMMVRLPFDTPVWQIALSVLSLILGTVALVWLGARIFRVGILMYGKKPTIKDLWQWIRYN